MTANPFSVARQDFTSLPEPLPTRLPWLQPTRSVSSRSWMLVNKAKFIITQRSTFLLLSGKEQIILTWSLPPTHSQPHFAFFLSLLLNFPLSICGAVTRGGMAAPQSWSGRDGAGHLASSHGGCSAH